ncbi:hypothetical protein M409DRAFT_68138 [Zasmidium cellare ATCC 36951]|uniref:DNA mismatch repair protein S5 domain-containing protein n=1 Tax=Zasmidium cellare ATCC 36951 TaxID=1080233 RepID=A0A6A6CD60_ZASCE|nr:uncharacterized protein M409DRAFT_68138 [Zasmidium cellare ATCC 36951]KAF2163862.1 hypothetical protein M409DRAFT_68138 [Zasmidium cellare ATCC 36951]
MGIQALPDTTVRAIGATQVLTDPAALVKELVDNALDAHANSISVEIHNNTLDVIQVRDNGHGIAPEDRPLVARRYCTSKLLDYDDLKDIGGSSLGFRGEALASAAELSGSLTISTRIEGEQVGAALKINQKGEVVGKDRASLPVGTCVKVTEFIKANPVRRQVTLKNTEACLKKIKRCLQAYAFARPHVRYSLRVLKAKTTKGDWVYAPKLNGNIEDAAIKVIGSACASQCLWSVLEHEGFSFQAFLPRPDADASKIGGHGSFISVDARPVSSARGHFKQIVKAFREALRRAGSLLDDIKEPFLHLEIGCPDDSYDVNVEPAKDDVAFEDAVKVIEGVKTLFAAVYAPQTEEEDVRAMSQPILEIGHGLDDHETAATSATARIEAANATSTGVNTVEVREEQPTLPNATEDEQVTSERRRTFRSNMYGCDEEDLELLETQPQDDRSAAHLEELRQANRDVNVSNPWVLAKLNSSVRRSDVQQPSPRDDEPLQRTDILSSPVRRNATFVETAEAALPTPRPSSPSPPAFHPSDHVPDMRLARNGNTIGAQDFPPPQMYTPMHSSDPIEPQDLRARRQNQSPDYNYDLTSDPPAGTPLAAIPDISTHPHRIPRKQDPQSRLNKPFVPPFKDGPPRERVWFDHLEDVERPRRPRPRPQNDGHGLVVQGELGDLVEDARPLTPPRRNRDIRDFVDGGESIASMIEARNYRRGPIRGSDANQETRIFDERVRRDTDDLRRHGFVRAREVADMNNDPNSPEKHASTSKRRKTSERQPLQDLSTNAPTAQEPEAANDEKHRPPTTTTPSRRRQSSHKLGRTKSSKLPLERTPPGQAMHNLILPVPISIDGISKVAGQIDEESSLLGFNQPAVGFESVFTADPPSLEGLTRSLHGLLVRAGGDDDEGAGVEGLFRKVQKALERHSRNDDDGGGGDDEIMSLV